ncbi:unnamed protein product [Tilletia controversa]|uniref:Uncharacterized protein n=3 Tax=Tilletia TaxID=13289 RepID=A0A8X7MPD1_9BASI|nr:hypothetical protein CF328_g8957 [Tilletia controversa]KAE8189057.1 hypothetical protein CF336_g5901 [Tilletia laevis]KAE8256573.1 hypothetical protein A4X03_0g5271 [Tilletia caries]KAE8195022.1 hypothetical protein CF335_g5195 [Tilletia laevis]KAE8243356.1 hypothetical protein A4X06_0g6374 [Tilletia controversa]
MVRFKNRWLLVTFSFDPTPPPSSSSSLPTTPPILTAADITKLLRVSIQSNFGDLGSGAHGGNVQCRYYSPHLHTAIIRSARESLKYVWAAVTLIAESKGRRVRTRVIHVGGTIKKVQLKAMGLDKAAINDLSKLMVDESTSTATASMIPSLPPASEPMSTAALALLADDQGEEDTGEAI